LDRFGNLLFGVDRLHKRKLIDHIKLAGLLGDLKGDSSQLEPQTEQPSKRENLQFLFKPKNKIINHREYMESPHRISSLHKWRFLLNVILIRA
jgi:hypothetical protein